MNKKNIDQIKGLIHQHGSLNLQIKLKRTRCPYCYAVRDEQSAWSDDFAYTKKRKLLSSRVENQIRSKRVSLGPDGQRCYNTFFVQNNTIYSETINFVSECDCYNSLVLEYNTQKLFGQ